MTRSNSSLDLPAKSLLIVLSGPSGAGKDAVLSRMKQSGLPLEFITTVTTRPKRPNEIDKVHYVFISQAEFQAMRARGDLLESAEVYGNWYGVPKKAIREAFQKSRDTIVKVDVQGAATIKKLHPQAVFIFVTPPSIEELVERLKQRNTESSFDFELRTKKAQEEVERLSLFDYIVINRKGEIDRAVSQIEAIITAEKCRVKPREVNL